MITGYSAGEIGTQSGCFSGNKIRKEENKGKDLM
jgi:hypothetical protein